MRKYLLVCIPLLLLVGCRESNSGDEVNKLEKTVSSLKKENGELNKRIESLQSIIDTLDSSSTNSSSSSSSSSENKKSEYGLNVDVPLTDGSKETLRLKATKASTNQADFPEHMISLDTYDTSKMVSVTFEYTNVAYGEAFLPHAQYFQAFTKDGKSLERVNQQDGQDMVTEGRTGTTKLFWELPIDGSQFDEIEIDFVPSNEKVATFKLPVSH